MPPDNLDQDPNKLGFVNLYAFFKISNNASNAEIDKSFRKMSLTWHPDKNKNNAEATQMFMKLSAWRDLLKDTQRRMEYDANLAWFKNGKKGPRPGELQDEPPSSYSDAPYTEMTRDRTPYKYYPNASHTSGRSAYEPSPQYESRAPQDHTPRYETREPSDYERAGPERRYRSSRPREEAEPQCQCPDCGQPLESSRRREDESRPSRSSRMYEETPRYESRMSPGYSSRRREEPEHRSSHRSFRRESPGIIIIEEFFDYDDMDHGDELVFEYESRGPFKRAGNSFFESSFDPSGYGSRRQQAPRSGYGFYQRSGDYR